MEDIKNQKTGDLIDRMCDICFDTYDHEWDSIDSELSEIKIELLRRESELVSIGLWSARRLHKAHKESAYNALEKITGQKHERL